MKFSELNQYINSKLSTQYDMALYYSDSYLGDKPTRIKLFYFDPCV